MEIVGGKSGIIQQIYITTVLLFCNEIFYCFNGLL